MKFAAVWTRGMAVAIAIYATAVFAVACGGGLLAWLLALPGAFVGLHLLALPIVGCCELLESCAGLPNRWRANVHEWLIIAALICLGTAFLPPLARVASFIFFVTMLIMRLACNHFWKPVAPVEVTP